MPRKDLVWPYGGRYDSAAHADLPALYTPKARSVRNRDPVSGRIRGATRSMLARWNPDPIGTSRVKALVSTAFDTRKVAFSFTEGDEELVWAVATPSKTDSLEGRTDSQGNVYALDGPAGIVKTNSAGRQIQKIALPVADPAHIVRALWIDETDRIFAGVSAGGDVATARVWCILQLPEDQYHVLWTLTPGAYTESLRLYRGTQLYAAHNYPQERRGRVLIYESLGLSPRESGRIEDVAYPINDMDVGADGSVYHAAPGDSTGFSDLRPGHPSAVDFHTPIRAWSLFDLDDARHRWWSIYDAEFIDETDLDQEARTEAAIEDGMQVLRWRDISGNDRHYYHGGIYLATESGPRYSRIGPGGLPAVRFTNTPVVGATPAVLQSMATLGNASIDVQLADQQRTAIPAYEGAMWAWFCLFRPTKDADVTIPSPRIVWSAQNEAVAPASDHILFFNRDCGAALIGAYAKNYVSYYAATDATGDDGQCAAGVANQALAYDTTGVQTGMVLVTVLWDGGVDPNDTTKTRCIVRVNGVPVDRFEGLPFTSLKPNWLAYADPLVSSDGDDPERRLNGEIVFMASLDRRNRAALTEPKVATHDELETGDPTQAQTDNEIARIEAMICYAKGCGGILPNSAAFYPHFYGLADNGSSIFLGGPPKPGTGGLSDPHAQILHQEPLVAKHDSQGKLQWVVNMHTHPDGNDEDSGGYGWGVRARTIESDGKTHVWMTGPAALFPTNPSEVALRKVIDLGTTFSGLQADGAWRHRFVGNAMPDYAYPRMAADKFGNLFYPGYNSTGGGTMRSLHVFAKDPDGGGDAVQRTEFLLAGDAAFAHAVALPPDALMPEYRADIASPIAPTVYLFTKQADASAFESVHRVDLVLVTSTTTGNPEDVITLAVVDDDVYGVTPTTSAIVSGGSAAIDGTSQFVQAIRAGEDIVISDGKSLLAYSLRDATLAPLVSTSSGEVPGPARLIMYWRHRLFLALEGGKYAASRLGRIRDWNLRPGSTLSGIARQTSTQAFTGSITRAGEAEDSIVALVPVWDDLAYLVGKTRILRLTGDPQDGGQIHVVGNSTGGAFGDSHCMDDQGRVFLWGRDPRGLYILPPVGDLIPLTDKTLEASEFQDIDMATHRMLLAWDPTEHVVRVYQVAWATSTVVAHWSWEERSHRLVKAAPIWQDRYAAASLQPTAIAHLGGESENGLIVGCEDSVIRFYDPEGRDDDGTACDAYVVFELSSDLPQHRSMLLTELEIVLASDQEGCMAELFAAETAERLGPILASRVLKPGRNTWLVRLSGPHLFLRLRNAATGRFSFEEGSYEYEDGGMVRGRAV